MLSGKRPARWLISTCGSGLADCLSGAITSFYVALLTQRAFVLFHSNPDLHYEWAYNQPHINWTLPISRGAVKLGGFPMLTIIAKNVSMENPLIAALHAGNMSSFHANERYLGITTNAGVVVKHMVDNPRYQGIFEQMGISANTAYQCAYAFLFSPNLHVRNLFKMEAALLQRPDYISIGVQIRLGDDVLAEATKPLPLELLQWFQPYLECVYTLTSLVNTVVPKRKVREKPASRVMG